MDNNQEHPQSHLFTLRLWPETLGEGQFEWRGKIRHVTSGETGYFRDWSSLVAFLIEMLPKLSDDQPPIEKA